MNTFQIDWGLIIVANIYTIIDESTLGAGASTSLSDNQQAIKLTDKANTLVIQAKATGDASCTEDVRVHIRGSIDDDDYSTVDIGAYQTGYFDIPVSDDAGNVVRVVTAHDFAYNYLKFIVENLDSGYGVSDILIRANIKTQDVT